MDATAGKGFPGTTHPVERTTLGGETFPRSESANEIRAASTGSDREAVWRLLERVLADVPRLAGAACVDRAELFAEPAEGESADTLEYRLAAARRVCRSCPALASCSSWAYGQRGRLSGVVAGRLRTTRRRASEKPIGSTDERNKSA